MHYWRVTGCLRLHYTCFGSTQRRAPEIPALQRSRLLKRFQNDVTAGEQLWCERNDAVFRSAQSTTSASSTLLDYECTSVIHLGYART
uniref:Uncharacterized protein n=1 Tax=Hyaloperonospora arabidopsidis (strain Emoy2) TaxID=559515 RepID=M4B844_HYAAE